MKNLYAAIVDFPHSWQTKKIGGVRSSKNMSIRIGDRRTIHGSTWRGTTEMRNGTHETADGVEICIPLPPVTKKNSQRIGYRNINGKQVPFIIPSAKYKQYEKDCGFFLKPLGISEPINIRAVFYMSTRRKVDLTNLNEALHDALVTNGTLEDDNSSIVVGTDGSRVLYDKKTLGPKSGSQKSKKKSDH